MKEVELGPWSFQIAVVKEKLEPSEYVLPASTEETDDMRRSEEPVLVNTSQDFQIPCRQLEGPNVVRPAKAGKARMGHSRIVPRSMLL